MNESPKRGRARPGAAPLAAIRSFLLLGAALFFVQCEDDACEAGDYCECRGGHECYLECDGDRCDQECSSVDRCGLVCDDGCSFTCHSTEACSASCGSNCSTECYETQSCGAICGSGCDYDCHNANKCGARVGPNSTVRCSSVGSCVVECEGSCRVFCNGVGSCDVDCARGGGPTPCSDGSSECRECTG
jgi:hypothetical protein